MLMKSAFVKMFGKWLCSLGFHILSKDKIYIPPHYKCERCGFDWYKIEGFDGTDNS